MGQAEVDAVSKGPGSEYKHGIQRVADQCRYGIQRVTDWYIHGFQRIVGQCTCIIQRVVGCKTDAVTKGLQVVDMIKSILSNELCQ